MGQQKPHALDAIYTRMGELETLLIQPVPPEREVQNLARHFANFRMALNMTRAQIDLLDQHLLFSNNAAQRGALLQLRQTIERAILAQFEICIVGRLERLRNDQAAAAGRSRVVARSNR